MESRAVVSELVKKYIDLVENKRFRDITEGKANIERKAELAKR